LKIYEVGLFWACLVQVLQQLFLVRLEMCFVFKSHQYHTALSAMHTFPVLFLAPWAAIGDGATRAALSRFLEQRAALRAPAALAFVFVGQEARDFVDEMHVKERRARPAVQLLLLLVLRR
jgi:hypothetical protein